MSAQRVSYYKECKKRVDAIKLTIPNIDRWTARLPKLISSVTMAANGVDSRFREVIKSIEGIEWNTIKNMFQTTQEESFSAILSGVIINFPEPEDVTPRFTLPNTLKNFEIPFVSEIELTYPTQLVKLFQNCTTINYINLSSLTDYSKTSNLSYMFDNCPSLERVDISHITGDYIETATDMFNLGLPSEDEESRTIIIKAKGSLFNKLNQIEDSKFTISEGMSFSDDVTYNQRCTVTKKGVSTGANMSYKQFKDMLESVETTSYTWKTYADLVIDYNDNDNNPATNPLHLGPSLKTLIIDCDYLSLPDTIHDMFRGLEFIESISMINYTGNDLIGADNLFAGCVNLMHVMMPDLEATKLAHLAYMFDGCTSLTSVSLPMFKGTNLTSFVGIFRNCINLKNVSLPLFEGANVIYVDELFSHTSNIEQIDLSKFMGLSIQFAANAFDVQASPHITYITAYGSLFNKFASIDNSKFTIIDGSRLDPGSMYANQQVRANIDGMRITYVKVRWSAFRNELNNVETESYTYNVEGELFIDPADRFQNPVDSPLKLKSTLKHLTINAITLPAMLKHLFYNQPYVETIQLNQFTGETPNTDITEMFAECGSLVSVTWGVHEGKGIKCMDRTFANCVNYNKPETFKEFTGVNVVTCSSLYENCISLHVVDMPAFNPNAMCDAMFSGCVNLLRINLPALMGSLMPPESLTRFLSDCENLEVLNLDHYTGQTGTTINDVLDVIPTKSKLKTLILNNIEALEPLDAFKPFSSLEVLSISKFNDSPTLTNFTQLGLSSSELTIKELHMNAFTGEHVLSMENAFKGFTNITTIELNSFVGSNVETFNSAFCDCHNLQTLLIPSVNSPNCVNFNRLFDGCNVLSQINYNIILNANNVNNLLAAFEDCYELAGPVDLHALTSSSTVSMSWMFQNDAKITSVDLSGIKNIHSFEAGFRNCTSLVSVKFGPIDSDNMGLCGWMFDNCPTIRKIDFGGLTFKDIAQATDMLNILHNGGEPFELTLIILGEAINRITDKHDSRLIKFDDKDFTNGVMYTLKCTVDGDGVHLPSAEIKWSEFIDDIKTATGSEYVLIRKLITDKNVSKESPAENALSQAIPANVTKLTIYNKLPEYCGQMFNACNNITSINSSTDISSDITNASYMFGDCSSLTSLPSTFTGSNITNASYMFANCSSLTSLPSTFTGSNITHAVYMFGACSSLTSLPSFTGSNITNASYMFYNCAGLTDILETYLGPKVTYLNYAFDGCMSLYNIDISRLSASNLITARQAFRLSPDKEKTLGTLRVKANVNNKLIDLYESYYKLNKLTQTPGETVKESSTLVYSPSEGLHGLISDEP